MAKIETIKGKILQLDQGSFQNLCDSYLCKVGYSNLLSLGGEAGTRKTTLGTPDTYFIASDGKYIFVEYTTQKKNICKKIESDLMKCLDISKTGISHDRISEIIYCHTSSNISPSQDIELKNICTNFGINLKLIGIDQIAEDIYLFYHGLARDFLDIPIDTYQIKSYDDFVNCYNSNQMVASLDNKFLFRNQEIEDIGNAFSNVNVVVITGMPGVGKTRLALHYIKNHLDAENENVYCIHNNGLPIYDDLNIFIDKPGNYFLFVDDANQLSCLSHIFSFINNKRHGYNFKVLMTVREYALKKVINVISGIVFYEVVNIDVFSDNEIQELLQNSLGIFNQNYQKRIIMISEGNPYIAILAGNLAYKLNGLDSIDDVSKLYENYYFSTLRDNQFFTNNNLCITAGIISFMGFIHLDYLDSILYILMKKDLNRENFIANIHILHANKIVDIYNDKVVRFSDKCLSNYFIKYVFIDKKILSLSEVIRDCFLSYKERVIYAVNTLINIFRDELVLEFVNSEIKKIWNELSEDGSTMFWDFVKVFSIINPIETLVLLKNKINSEYKLVCKWSDIDTEKGKNFINVNNDIINILGDFVDTIDLPAACDLFFEYYLKRPDLFMEFYHAVNIYFAINKNSVHNDFFTQITFLNILKEYSNGWNHELVSNFFLQIAGNFLKFQFSKIEDDVKNKFILYKFSLTWSKGVENYRKIIWDCLISLCKNNQYIEGVRTILYNYGETAEYISIPILKFDLIYIEKILKCYFSPDELRNCILAKRIYRVFKKKDILCESIFTRYFQNEDFKIYNLLKGEINNFDIDYKNFEFCNKIKNNAIKSYVSSCNLEKFKKLIDVSSEIYVLDKQLPWPICDGLGFAFDAISNKQELYVGAIKYYIEKDMTLNLNINYFMSKLFSFLSDQEVYNIVNSHEYINKNVWLYSYYHELPSELITTEHLQGLYNFLQDTSDRNISSCLIRDLYFLEKYKVIDKEVLIKASEYILSKMDYSPFVVRVYFESLFYNNCAPQEIFQKFDFHFELIEKIYCTMLSLDSHFDSDGCFLRELYLARPSILEKYVSHLLGKDSVYFMNHKKIIRCFFDLENYAEVYNKILEMLSEEYDNFNIVILYFLESLLLPLENEIKLFSKQDVWIREYIRFYCFNQIKIRYLFKVISKFENKFKMEYFLLFIKCNSSFDDFKNIPLIPYFCGWERDILPMYFNCINFLKSLLPNFIGLKWLEHKQYIETNIERLKKIIESEQIDEMLTL